MDGTHAVSEVQEEFSWGMTFELARLRAAEKVGACHGRNPSGPTDSTRPWGSPLCLLAYQPDKYTIALMCFTPADRRPLWPHTPPLKCVMRVMAMCFCECSHVHG